LALALSSIADDLVILCRRATPKAALHHLREIMSKLKLTVNEGQDTDLQGPGRGVSTSWASRFGRMYSRTTGPGPAWHCDRQGMSIKRMVEKVSCAEPTEARNLARGPQKLVGELKPRVSRMGQLLQCWLIIPRPIARSITTQRCGLRRWLRSKHKVQATPRRGRIHSRTSTGTSGLVRLTQRGAAARRGRRREVLSESRMRAIRMSVR